ncbi:MAG TPA: nicotinamide riboside transporter PnuC [Bacteroidales bacterium]|nr:nicotinamide riboside transporter PnuC [Bacteroidales bacterium]
MTVPGWILNNWIEIFGAVTGIVYVFLEIKQNLWLWPVGIVTSAVYVWIFLHGKLYADMSLQCYYLLISVAGWYWWMRGRTRRRRDEETERQDEGERHELRVTRIKPRLALILLAVFAGLYVSMFFVLGSFTDSPVPGFDAFITSLSIIATWMLARKIYEHWFLWIIVNLTATGLFLYRGLYPTVVLYAVYCSMSFSGLREWRKSLG